MKSDAADAAGLDAAGLVVRDLNRSDRPSARPDPVHPLSLAQSRNGSTPGQPAPDDPGRNDSAPNEPVLAPIEVTATAGATDSPELTELVAAAGRGERRAIEQLLGYIQPRIIRYCRGRVGRNDRSFSSADDVAQEVMVAVLKALPRYTERGRPFLAFVYGIAHNKVADAHRVAHRNRSDPYDEVPDSPDVAGGPEALALAGDLQGRLRTYLDRLQRNQREILLYRVVVGLSAEETADVVGSTAGAVRVAQHRAVTKLRAMIAGEDM